MTVFSRGPDPADAFEKSLVECMDELNKLMPGLSVRYSEPVMVSALAEQMGSGLQVLLRKKFCDPVQIRFLLRSVEDFAFHNPDIPGGAPGPQTDSTH